MASFDVILQTRASLYASDDPSEFISEYTGVITCVDDETDAETKVGRLSALRVHAGLACNAGESLFDVCDSHSRELQYLHSLLYEPDGHFFKDVVATRFHADHADLLLIDYVILNPRWRKLNLGLLAVRKAIDLLGGGVGLAVSNISPLLPECHKSMRVPASWLPGHATAGARRAACVRLRHHFRRMGFVRVGRTPYYVLSLTQILPTAAQLLGPDAGT